MAKKNILIVEDHGLIAETLSELLVNYLGQDYNPESFIRDSNQIVSELESYLSLNKKPDFVIYDGLNGEWEKVHRLLDEKGIKSCLFSGTDYSLFIAKKRGVDCFDKDEQYEEMIKHIRKTLETKVN